MDNQKSRIRKDRKNARLQINFNEREALSERIVGKLLRAADWEKVGLLHVFEPLLNLGEVDISGFIAFIEREYPDTGIYTTRQIESLWQLRRFKGEDDAPPPEQFDAVVVPMISFDETLQRIGYGGGYYDRFLGAQEKALKIGVCFEEGKIDHVPSEPHDVAMDMIITEAGVYRT